MLHLQGLFPGCLEEELLERASQGKVLEKDSVAPVPAHKQGRLCQLPPRCWVEQGDNGGPHIHTLNVPGPASSPTSTFFLEPRLNSNSL